MSTKNEESPVYIQDAKFINQEDNVDPDEWPRHIELYHETNNWRKRRKRLDDIVDDRMVESAFTAGHLYNSLSNSATFVEPHFGVAVYVVVSAELIKDGNGYPQDPGVFDYNYKLVTLWAYVYDKQMADLSPFWSDEDIKEIQQFCEEESGQAEVSKYDVDNQQ